MTPCPTCHSETGMGQEDLRGEGSPGERHMSPILDSVAPDSVCPNPTSARVYTTIRCRGVPGGSRVSSQASGDPRREGEVVGRGEDVLESTARVLKGSPGTGGSCHPPSRAGRRSSSSRQVQSSRPPSLESTGAGELSTLGGSGSLERPVSPGAVPSPSGCGVALGVQEWP